MDWAAYDEAFALAPYAQTTTYLKPPMDGCTFGCVPLKRTNATILERLAAGLPWRGKCFSAAEEGAMVGDSLVHLRPLCVENRRVASSRIYIWRDIYLDRLAEKAERSCMPSGVFTGALNPSPITRSHLCANP